MDHFFLSIELAWCCLNSTNQIASFENQSARSRSFHEIEHFDWLQHLPFGRDATLGNVSKLPYTYFGI